MRAWLFRKYWSRREAIGISAATTMLNQGDVWMALGTVAIFLIIQGMIWDAGR